MGHATAIADGAITQAKVANLTSDLAGKAPLDSPTFTGVPSGPTATPGTNTTQFSTTAFVQALVSAAATGVLNLKGSINASTNPNYPSASTGDTYYITVAGKIGGASGKSVDIGDTVIASANNAGGTEAAVGTSWFVLEHNLVGALLSSNNLSDLASAATARTNLAVRPYGRVTFSNADATIAATTVYAAQVGTMSAPRTVTLPAASAVPAGWELVVADESGTISSTNTITFTRAGADTINGATTLVMLSPYGWRRFISDGVSSWLFDGGMLRAGNNLSDLLSASTARTNLGLGTLATLNAAPAGTLTGATLASGVTASSLTSVGTLAALTVTATITGSVTGSSGSTTGNASTVTTNANLTGPITSVGNATSIASQTGTGTKFVVDTSPTLITPTLGVASSTSENITGTGGAGFIGYAVQSAAPAAPAGGFRQYADATGKFSWIRQSDGFARSFDATLTANRVYTLPDASITFARTDAAQTFTGDQTFTGRIIDSVAGALSAPAGTFTGTWITGGTATTTKPHFLIEPTGATSTGWIANGTGLGINSASGFVGNLIDCQVNGVSMFNVSNTGNIIAAYLTTSPYIIATVNVALTNNSGLVVFGSTSDAIIGRQAAANLRQGAADAASPVAQTFSVQSVVAGTSNTAGANRTISGSKGTGTGTGGSIILSTAPAGSTGTAQNALVAALTITGAGAITHGLAKPLTITSGTDQRAGDTVLVGGTVTVSNTTVTTNTRVFVSRKTSGGTLGTSMTYTVSAGSFTLTSSSTLDTSTFSYFLIEIV